MANLDSTVTIKLDEENINALTSTIEAGVDDINKKIKLIERMRKKDKWQLAQNRNR